MFCIWILLLKSVDRILARHLQWSVVFLFLMSPFLRVFERKVKRACLNVVIFYTATLNCLAWNQIGRLTAFTESKFNSWKVFLNEIHLQSCFVRILFQREFAILDWLFSVCFCEIVFLVSLTRWACETLLLSGWTSLISFLRLPIVFFFH